MWRWDTAGAKRQGEEKKQKQNNNKKEGKGTATQYFWAKAENSIRTQNAIKGNKCSKSGKEVKILCINIVLILKLQ